MSGIKIDVTALRDIEASLLNYMLLSKANFRDIKENLTEADFTFVVHALIFKYFIALEEEYFFENKHGITDMATIISILAEMLQNEEDVHKNLISEILSQTPSTHKENDLAILNETFIEKQIAIHNNEIRRKGCIETKDTLTWFNFLNDRLISVGTVNMGPLPVELHTSFQATYGAVTLLESQDGDNEISMMYYGEVGSPVDIESFYLKKDVTKLKWFDNICMWADKYNLDENTFPRDKYKLQNLFKLDISNKMINELPKEIGNLTNLRMLIMDNNNIKEFPKELYQLELLGVLSFVNNRVSYLSQEVANFQELLLFAACGNDIKILPQSISKLVNLEFLDIENTQVIEIPVELLGHGNLKKLCINDSLLASVIKNVKYLKVDTINLSASDYHESSEIIQELNFRIDTKVWMEDRDKKDNGCLQLFIYENIEGQR